MKRCRRRWGRKTSIYWSEVSRRRPMRDALIVVALLVWLMIDWCYNNGKNVPQVFHRDIDEFWAIPDLVSIGKEQKIAAICTWDRRVVDVNKLFSWLWNLHDCYSFEYQNSDHEIHSGPGLRSISMHTDRSIQKSELGKARVSRLCLETL